MKRRIGIVLTGLLITGATQLMVASPASAEPTCQPIITDSNGDWVVYVCAEQGENHQGLPTVNVYGGAPGTSFDVFVSVVTGHIGQQQTLCVGLLQDTTRPINVCLLPTP